MFNWKPFGAGGISSPGRDIFTQPIFWGKSIYIYIYSELKEDLGGQIRSNSPKLSAGNFWVFLIRSCCLQTRLPEIFKFFAHRHVRYLG